MSTPKAELARKSSEIARARDGLTRRAASYAAMALSAGVSVADARSALAALWQATFARPQST